MLTSPRHRDEHGGHQWRWSAVLVLAVTSLAAFWVVTRSPWIGQALEELRPQARTSASVDSSRGAEVAGPSAAGSTGRPMKGVGRPRQLDVPALDLHAPVVPIDLAGHVLTPPDDPALVGWWQDGAGAGSATGAVVLTGHTVHTGGGAMDHLEQISSGDLVVLTVRDATIRYRVDRVEVLSKSALADRAEVLFSQQGPGRLVLVTRENWNGEEYESNVVVSARPVG